MPTTDPVIGRGLVRPNARKSTAKVTVRSNKSSCGEETAANTLVRAEEEADEKGPSYRLDTGAACWDCAKNAHTCRPVPVGALAAVRAFWELNRQLKRANSDPDDAWRTAAQRAAQQLRACGSGAALPAAPGPAPALASFGEIAEKSPEERKIMALETIAEAARLWIQLNKPDEEDEEDEEEVEEDN
ncbi:hypothetical protein BFJ63_vAg17411 [Fusarium oxysporum f. sp. narcissi]|uniref:Uncharacterized protein n=1 Tax=Fusarium oxysporum f. sp. narcissi TaxID=451672 RepID=A0A4Q2V700_FUSOX|nr:hypothetical protein BFJ63_vAg17411 [Fusarium oxysporum f. sp. narcissi]